MNDPKPLDGVLGAPPPTMRDFDDAPAMRENIFAGVHKAASEKFPIENTRHRLELHNLKYEDMKPFSLQEQKKAIMSGNSLNKKLMGEWRLVDKATNKVIDKKAGVIAHVPYATDRGTFIYNGSEWTCFHKSVAVWTDQGMLPIGRIVNEKMQVKVWSYDFSTSKFVLKPIVSWFKNNVKAKLGHSEFYAPSRLGSRAKRFNPTTLWGTQTHKVYTPSGNKIDLKSASKLTMVQESLSYTQEQLLYGSLLGDAHVDESGLLRFIHCEAQYEYLELKQNIFRPLCTAEINKYKDSRSDKPQGKFSVNAHAAFREARTLCYPEGTKKVTLEWLNKIDKMGLAFWFADDGSSRYKNATNSPELSLYTNGFTEAEVILICEWFGTRWGLGCHKDRSEKVYGGRDIGWYILFDAESSRLLMELVAPYIPNCLAYKLLAKPKVSVCERCEAPVDPVRNVCDQCTLQEVRCTPGSLSKSVRVRFGDSATARALAAGPEVRNQPPVHLTRWEALQRVQGTAVPAMLDDVNIGLKLVEIPCEYKENLGRTYERTQIVYDIEVEGTHNYFANGVLVSNCANQQRLRPGVFSRVKDNGVIEAHANVKPGTGSAFRVYMEPDTGVFRLSVGQSNLKLLPILKSMGVKDHELEHHWGRELLQKNIEAEDPRAVARAVAKLVTTRADQAVGGADQEAVSKLASERLLAIESALEESFVKEAGILDRIPGIVGGLGAIGSVTPGVAGAFTMPANVGLTTTQGMHEAKDKKDSPGFFKRLLAGTAAAATVLGMGTAPVVYSPAAKDLANLGADPSPTGRLARYAIAGHDLTNQRVFGMFGVAPFMSKLRNAGYGVERVFRKLDDHEAYYQNHYESFRKSPYAGLKKLVEEHHEPHITQLKAKYNLSHDQAYEKLQQSTHLGHFIKALDAAETAGEPLKTTLDQLYEDKRNAPIINNLSNTVVGHANSYSKLLSTLKSLPLYGIGSLALTGAMSPADAATAGLGTYGWLSALEAQPRLGERGVPGGFSGSSFGGATQGNYGGVGGMGLNPITGYARGYHMVRGPDGHRHKVAAEQALPLGEVGLQKKDDGNVELMLNNDSAPTPLVVKTKKSPRPLIDPADDPDQYLLHTRYNIPRGPSPVEIQAAISGVLANIKAAGVTIGAEEADRRWTQLWFRGKLDANSHNGKDWVLLEVHKGLCEAAFESLKEEGIKCEAKFSNPHISVLRPEDVEMLKKKHGNKWQGAARIGTSLRFKLMRIVNLIPHGWDQYDRVWFLECESPDLEQYRKDLGLPPLPVKAGTDHHMRFHVTFAVHRNAVKQACELLTEERAMFWDSMFKQADEAALPKPTDPGAQLKGVFDKAEFDPDVTEATLGERFHNASIPMFLRTTNKLIKISRGEEKPDDRDSLAYQTFHSPEDFFAERIRRDAGMVARKSLWKSTLRGNLQHMPTSPLTGQLAGVLLNSGMGQPLEEVNPMEIHDQNLRVLRLGEGGISGLELIPLESRAVQPSHFGFIDPIRSPESASIGVDSRVAHGTKKGSDGKIYQQLLNAKTGQMEYISAEKMARSRVAFPGEFKIS